MTKPRILVTAAAGHTGSPAVVQLLEQGFPVRAFVRRADVRSAALEKGGAEIFVGDMFDYGDLRDQAEVNHGSVIYRIVPKGELDLQQSHNFLFLP